MAEGRKSYVSVPSRKGYLPVSKSTNRLFPAPLGPAIAICSQMCIRDRGDIYVVLNARKETAKVSVPEGKYTVVCKDGFISEKGLGTMYGPEISVPAQSALIFYK